MAVVGLTQSLVQRGVPALDADQTVDHRGLKSPARATRSASFPIARPHPDQAPRD